MSNCSSLRFRSSIHTYIKHHYFAIQFVYLKTKRMSCSSFTTLPLLLMHLSLQICAYRDDQQQQKQHIAIEVAKGNMQITYANSVSLSSIDSKHTELHVFNVCVTVAACNSKVRILNIRSLGLRSFPAMLTNSWFPTLTRLDLSHNFIEELLPSRHFEHMLSRWTLKELDLSSNRLSVIGKEAFSALQRLKRLNLANNAIRSVDMFAFVAFGGKHTLLELNLDRNKIGDDELEFLLFSSLTTLRRLTLDNNSLTTISAHLFYNLHSLEAASFSHNRLASFDLFALSSNSNSNEKLKRLDLSFNHDLKLDTEQRAAAGESNSSLEVLNLAGVYLRRHVDASSLLDRLFEKFRRLRVLNMSFSRLSTRLAPSALWPVTLHTLDLSNNLLRDAHIDVSQWRQPRLHTLDLSCNLLANMSRLTLHFHHSLEIDLRQNRFASIELRDDKHDIGVRLLLADNPFVCDCDEHKWWWHTRSVNMTGVVYDLEQLTCLSLKSREETNFELQTFQLIRGSRLIASTLRCPYKAPLCPLACRCVRDFAGTYDLINCTHANLSSLPTHLPSNATRLLLAQNAIVRLAPRAIDELGLLVSLDLSRNGLSYIEKDAFCGLFALRTLRLSHNAIQILLGVEFGADLGALEELRIDYNRIQFVSNRTFAFLRSLRLLDLSGNMLVHALEPSVFFAGHQALLRVLVDSTKSDAAALLVALDLVASENMLFFWHHKIKTWKVLACICVLVTLLVIVAIIARPDMCRFLAANKTLKHDISSKSEYDLLIVYNKLDESLVENVLLNELRRIHGNIHTRLLHQFEEEEEEDEEDRDQLISRSSMVLLVFTDNAFTRDEYELAKRTPYFKKLVIIVKQTPDGAFQFS